MTTRAEADKGETNYVPKPRKLKRAAQLIPPVRAARAKAPSTEQTTVPTHVLRLTLEASLMNFDNDIELLVMEINQKLKRKGDLDVGRDAVLASLAILDAATSVDGTYLQHPSQPRTNGQDHAVGLLSGQAGTGNTPLHAEH